MKENNSPLHYRIFEAPLVIKNYVKGDEACNYEKYLVELINASAWFQNHFRSSFALTEDESHGQCDAYSDLYGLDFKLIASKTFLQARSIHSEQIVIMTKGLYAHCAPKQNGSMQVTRFPQAIRGKAIEELLDIRDNATKQQGIENDIAEYLDTLETNKNLLLFFPYKFHFETPGDPKEDILNVVQLCNKDFGVSLNYRYSLYPTLDTYFAFFYSYSCVLCKWNGQCLVYLDTVPMDKSETFVHLALTYSEEWSEPYDEVLKMLRDGKTGKEIEKALLDEE